MSRAALLLVVPVMLACTKTDTPPADTSALAVAPDAAAAAPVNYAGAWTVTVMPQDKDTVLLTYPLVATNEMTGWVMTLPGREPMQPRVISLDNDSVVLENGPYPSVLRKNVTVSTHSTMRMEGDRLVGTTIAHYSSRGPDSVATLRTQATRQ